MTAGELILAAFVTFWSSALSALVWTGNRRREERLDRRFDRLEERLDQQIASVRGDLTQIALAVGVTPHSSHG
ncbi:MAG: hypothetical protein M3161_01720 [Actinomycetota bacterium]|nr:hypothetical protein [Actinomycetota bacterium]